jgi:hypothetical protein
MNLAPILNAFPRKTRVTFIHAVTGKEIGIQKMKPEELPLSFTRPHTMELNGISWRVMQAVPVYAKEFNLDYKLTLYIQESSSVNRHGMSDLPTICNDHPVLYQESLFNDFVLNISSGQWRQLEFFSQSFLSIVQEEITRVENILSPGEGVNTLLGYKDIYTRNKIPDIALAIPFDEFCRQYHILEKGAVNFNGNGFIQDGVSLRSKNYTYYGKVNKNIIEELYLESFESVDEEFYELTSSYSLALADWCNGMIITI